MDGFGRKSNHFVGRSSFGHGPEEPIRAKHDLARARAKSSLEFGVFLRSYSTHRTTLTRIPTSDQFNISKRVKSYNGSGTVART